MLSNSQCYLLLENTAAKLKWMKTTKTNIKEPHRKADVVALVPNHWAWTAWTMTRIMQRLGYTCRSRRRSVCQGRTSSLWCFGYLASLQLVFVTSLNNDDATETDVYDSKWSEYSKKTDRHKRSFMRCQIDLDSKQERIDSVYTVHSTAATDNGLL